MMIKRVEFSLNLEDPREAAIYRALYPAIRYRRAGAMIRQALVEFLRPESPQQPSLPNIQGYERRHE
ncbi:MAG: hypothetical protein IPK19_11495 [Chloroflexi bacterium]|nr:hypothetical protein [Chloroflexota bacterium]